MLVNTMEWIALIRTHLALQPSGSMFRIATLHGKGTFNCTTEYVAALGAAGAMDRPAVNYREFDGNRDVSISVLEPPTDTGTLLKHHGVLGYNSYHGPCNPDSATMFAE